MNKDLQVFYSIFNKQPTWRLYYCGAIENSGNGNWKMEMENRNYSKNSSAVKKGKAKKVQVTEQLKDVISLWGQQEKLHQLSCV